MFKRLLFGLGIFAVAAAAGTVDVADNLAVGFDAIHQTVIPYAGLGTVSA